MEMDRGVTGLKVLGFGDQVVDRYLTTGKMYPGGNALNFAVFARMLGAESSFLGTFGTDAAAEHVRAALAVVGVPTTLSRTVEGENGYADVRLVDGNRVFVSSNKGGVAGQTPFVLDRADLDYADGFSLLHTSCYSHLNGHVRTLRSTEALLSYDFSYRWQVDDLIPSIAPHLDFAALSAGDVGRETAKAALREIVDLGCGLALATLGSEGAIAYNGDQYVAVAPIETTIVDTLGAGDAFIAAALLSLLTSGWRRGTSVPAEKVLVAMERGARFAAKICGLEGAFGYPAAMPASELAQPPSSH
jgi:fructoselysine 6-kinase